MIKVAALTSGLDVPSTRFRVRQHIEGLLDYGVDVEEYYPLISKDMQAPFVQSRLGRTISLPLKSAFAGAKLVCTIPGIIGSFGADATWLSKGVLLTHATVEGFLKKPIILDVDDAVWIRDGSELSSARRIAKRSQVVIAGNSYIAEWYAQYCRNVFITPTAVDTEKYVPGNRHTRNDITFGWIGTSHNLRYLSRLEWPLARFFEKHPSSKLLIVSDKKPDFMQLSDKNFRYIPWSAETEVEMIQEMDVGLMPLDDTPWSRGKCAFKMLQYMSCGKPVIVSPVGMNVEVLAKGDIGLSAVTPENWLSGLVAMQEETSMRMKMGKNARKVVVENYSLQVVTPCIANIIKKAL